MYRRRSNKLLRLCCLPDFIVFYTNMEVVCLIKVLKVEVIKKY